MHIFKNLLQKMIRIKFLNNKNYAHSIMKVIHLLNVTSK